MTAFDTMTDFEKWKWIKDNQDKQPLVVLDGEDIFVAFIDGNEYFDFENSVLSDKHVFSEMLEAFGIACESI
jgi:predicted lactoylglutathione lyase